MNHLQIPFNCMHIFPPKICNIFTSIWANLNITHNFSLFYITFLNMSFLEAKTNLKAFQYYLGRLNFSLKVLKDRVNDNRLVQEVTIRRM
jgi:hypothetical protein